MKKVFLLIAAISISFGAIAQKGKVTGALTMIGQGQLDKAKEAIDAALVNEKTATWPNTYYAKGKLCQAVFESDNAKFKELCPNPLDEAYASYEKAMELDPKGGIKKKIITEMVYTTLAIDLYNQGVKLFETKDFSNALKSFETQIKITESDKFAGAVDTGMYYNAGLAAFNGKDYKTAIKYFEKCADMGYLGVTPYFQISESYLGLNDTVKAESVLKSVNEKFPNDKNVTLTLIDLYIKGEKDEEALKYIEKAKQDDPNNATLYYAAGIIYLRQGDKDPSKFDLAIPELTKSIELKPDVYDSQFGLGAAYINKASDMFVKANDIMDVNKYTEAVNKANEVYAKALPYMEKALELKPDDVYAMNSLKELYYRLKMTDKYNQVKAKLDAIK